MKTGDNKSSPNFVTAIPAGYRDWSMISVAHVGGKLNDLRGEAVHKTCFSCHKPAKDRDFVFTRYSP